MDNDIMNAGTEAVLVNNMIELMKFLRKRYYHAELWEIFSETKTDENHRMAKISHVDKFMSVIDEIDRRGI